MNTVLSLQGLRSGSTGVAAFISGDSLYIAWLGDSQVILCKGGQLVTLMNPHKPEREVRPLYNGRHSGFMLDRY